MARTTGTASLADLINREVLEGREPIVIRRRSAQPIAATVEADGTIRVGRRAFTTPTAAAKHALGVTAIDGWLRWRVPRLDHRTLAEVRDNP